MKDPKSQFECAHFETFEVYRCGNPECKGIHIIQKEGDKAVGSVTLPMVIGPMVAARIMAIMDESEDDGEKLQ